MKLLAIRANIYAFDIIFRGKEKKSKVNIYLYIR